MEPWRSAGLALGEERVELERCSTCGSARTLIAEVENPGALHSGGAYSPARGLAAGLIAPMRKLGEIDRLRSFRGLGPGDRVLEIGCGDGTLLAQLDSRGCEVRGLEPAGPSRQAAQARGLEVSGEPIEQAEFAAGSFDAIVLWHVIEHLERPDVVLARAHEWLSPDGVLICAAPNLSSWQAGLGGDGWFHQDIPRHRWHPTAQGLRELIGLAGFEPRRVRHFVIEQNPLGMWQSLLNRATANRNVAFRTLKRDPGLSGPLVRRDQMVTAILALPVALVSVVLEGLATAFRRGGTVACEAVRR